MRAGGVLCVGVVGVCVVLGGLRGLVCVPGCGVVRVELCWVSGLCLLALVRRRCSTVLPCLPGRPNGLDLMYLLGLLGLLCLLCLLCLL